MTLMKLTPKNIIIDFIDNIEFVALGMFIGVIIVGLMIYGNHLAEKKRLAEKTENEKIEENKPDWMNNEEAIKINDIE